MDDTRKSLNEFEPVRGSWVVAPELHYLDAVNVIVERHMEDASAMRRSLGDRHVLERRIYMQWAAARIL